MPITILLIEDDEKECEALSHSINNHDNMRLVGISNNASEAIELVQLHLPDVIILDLELHLGGGNGLAFLSQLKGLCLSHEPYILISTQNSSQLTLETARLLGADMIIAKYEMGYSAEYVIKTISLLESAIHKATLTDLSFSPESPEKFEHKLRIRVQRELSLIGINPKHKGYSYLTEAILLVYKNPQPNISSLLSPIFDATTTSIERAMQNAINRAWNTADPEELQSHYQATINTERGVPTVMEFIHYYARILKTEF